MISSCASFCEICPLARRGLSLKSSQVFFLKLNLYFNRNDPRFQLDFLPVLFAHVWMFFGSGPQVPHYKPWLDLNEDKAEIFLAGTQGYGNKGQGISASGWFYPVRVLFVFPCTLLFNQSVNARIRKCVRIEECVQKRTPSLASSGDVAVLLARVWILHVTRAHAYNGLQTPAGKRRLASGPCPPPHLAYNRAASAIFFGRWVQGSGGTFDTEQKARGAEEGEGQIEGEAGYAAATPVDRPFANGPRVVNVGIPGPGACRPLWRRAWCTKILPALHAFKYAPGSSSCAEQPSDRDGLGFEPCCLMFLRS